MQEIKNKESVIAEGNTKVTSLALDLKKNEDKIQEYKYEVSVKNDDNKKIKQMNEHMDSKIVALDL